METILAIEEVDDDDFSGYEITTDKQKIRIQIKNYQQCCESWGYFSTNDDITDFIGSVIHNIELVDEALNVDKLPKYATYLDAGGIIFVNINTNKGTLQLAVYNGHNGYYSHEVYIISTQLTENTYL